MKKKHPVQLHYIPFDAQEIITLFHPYILKEYNNRWFVYGHSDCFNNNGVYALDRIMAIEMKYLNSFKEANAKIISTYFNNIIGVTNTGNPVEEIIFTVCTPRCKYVNSKPFHESQRILKHNASYTRYVLKLRINNELIASLLSFGPDLIVEEPLILATEMARLTAKMYKNYHTAD